jgi:hypothetical protein
MYGCISIVIYYFTLGSNIHGTSSFLPYFGSVLSGISEHTKLGHHGVMTFFLFGLVVLDLAALGRRFSVDSTPVGAP